MVYNSFITSVLKNAWEKKEKTMEYQGMILVKDGYELIEAALLLNHAHRALWNWTDASGEADLHSIGKEVSGVDNNV